MRKTFSKEIERLAREDDKLVFITGDLGFNAFEHLQEILGDRFINAGVAEQHMVGMAAGLASKGMRVFVYSIAPFIVYRALEQVRNDICFHNLPVCLVGNGGGYGYGIMGSSHHTLSDVGIFSTLPNMRVYVPAFDNDIPLHLKQIAKQNGPSYLRLGYGPEQNRYVEYANQQLIHKTANPLLSICVMGPVVNNLLQHKEWKSISAFVDVFSIQGFPVDALSDTLQKSLQESQGLLTVEEHVTTGGLGQQMSYLLLKHGIPLNAFDSRYAVGYPHQEYGSQAFHQQQSELDGDGLISQIKKMIKND